MAGLALKVNIDLRSQALLSLSLDLEEKQRTKLLLILGTAD